MHYSILDYGIKHESLGMYKYVLQEKLVKMLLENIDKKSLLMYFEQKMYL